MFQPTSCGTSSGFYGLGWKILVEKSRSLHGAVGTHIPMQSCKGTVLQITLDPSSSLSSQRFSLSRCKCPFSHRPVLPAINLYRFSLRVVLQNIHCFWLATPFFSYYKALLSNSIHWMEEIVTLKLNKFQIDWYTQDFHQRAWIFWMLRLSSFALSGHCTQFLNP